MRDSDIQLVGEADTVSFFGYPGAGKETVSKPLMKDLVDAGVNTKLLEVGGIVRDHIRRNTKFGQYVRTLPKGALVPDGDIVPVIEEYIEGMDPNALWFYDGFPRSVEQVGAYLEVMERYGRNDVMVCLQLHDDYWLQYGISDERMRRRGEEAGDKARDDDRLVGARQKRLRESEELLDVRDMFAERGRLVVVDALQTKENVRSDIERLFSLHMDVQRSKNPQVSRSGASFRDVHGSASQPHVMNLSAE